jgi:hypothetical protein
VVTADAILPALGIAVGKADDGPPLFAYLRAGAPAQLPDPDASS